MSAAERRELWNAAILALALVLSYFVAGRVERLEHDLAEARAERSVRP